MTGKLADMALTSMFLIERFTLQRVWSGLSDDEFFWEPSPGSWSIRRREDCQTPNPFGVGDWVADYDVTVVSTDWAVHGEPMTTIAWLMWHFGSMPGRTAQLDYLGGAETADSGWTSPYRTDHPRFTSATQAVEALQAGWEELRSALRTANDEQLEQPVGSWGGRPTLGYQNLAALLNEVSHHGTQVCALRDFYRGRTP
ncbi:MAG TPA: DinB family protein [Acidimicrobiales bacterium]|nr:DinB family protein [Acidimicrobiales bacterium]